MRILMSNGGDEKRSEKFADHVLRITDANVATVAGHSGTVDRMGVGAYGDGRLAQDGDVVEGVGDVAHG